MDTHTQKILICSIIIFTFSIVNARSQSWEEVAKWEGQDLLESREQQKSLEEYDCLANSDTPCDIEKNVITQHGVRIPDPDMPFKRRSNYALSPIESWLPMKEKQPYISHFHTSRPQSCECESEFVPLRLNRAYLPRYLPTIVCLSDFCRGGTHRCHQRHYTVQVLKRRGPNIPESESSLPLPETLSKTWIFEALNVTVACECKP